MRNLIRILGEDGMSKVVELYEMSATIDHIETAFYASVGKLDDDELKNQAGLLVQQRKKFLLY